MTGRTDNVEIDEYPTGFAEKYEAIECLSRSEQGETLLVRCRADDSYCVAKLTHGRADCGEELLHDLSHTALPRHIEVLTEGDVSVSVREYIIGTSLDEYMRERPLSEGVVADIGVQLCDVLEYLHTRKPPVIHRDVKPQNVIITEKGRVALIDFGIARTYKQNAKKDTVFSGTNDFAPPEQYGFSQTDARADVFSLGMLLKYLLTDGDPEREVSSPRFSRIIRRCTAFSPDRRYPSAARVKRALERQSAPPRAFFAAGLALALFAGFALGRFTAAADVSAHVTVCQEEYDRAAAYGFLPAEAEGKDPRTTAVTWSEYCSMLGAVIDRYDPSLFDEWQALTKDAPNTAMNRDGGMVALLFAAEAMGVDSFNAEPPAEFAAYSPLVWNNVSLDYPVFDWNRYKRIDAGCFDDNYVGPAYDYSVRRVSLTTGFSLLEYDEKGDLRLEQPFTLFDAALSALRLYESTN